MVDLNPNPVALGYDAVYEATPRSPTLHRIWRELAAGADFPEEFLHISFVTLAQLRRMASELRLGPGDALVDLACGMAGPALWVARETASKLIGVDLSPVAVRLASERAAGLGLADAASFKIGSFEQTGLQAGSADAVMSEDAFQYAPDKAAALAKLPASCARKVASSSPRSKSKPPASPESPSSAMIRWLTTGRSSKTRASPSTPTKRRPAGRSRCSVFTMPCWMRRMP